VQGSWSITELAGKQADILELPDRNRPRGGILFLHDVDLVTLRDNSTYTDLFEKHGLVCVCPRVGASWWADRICPEFDREMSPERYVVEQVVPFFQQHWQLAPRSLAICGVGMGGQGALRLAFKHARLFQVAAGIGPMIDCHELYHEGTALDDMYDSKEQCRQDTATMHIHPTQFPAHIFFGIDPANQRWFRGNDRLHEKLGALGVTHEADFSATGTANIWPYANHLAERVVRFIAQGLEQQARRLM
jgi:S-formylglutathione hydrolase FrmB